MNKIIRYVVFSSLFVMLVMGSVVFCDTAKQSLTKITVLLDWVPNTNHTGLYVAKDLGYYRQEGLEVAIIQPSESDAAALVAAGKAEFGVSYQEQVTYAKTAANPLPIKVIAAVIQHNTSGFASPIGKNIKNPNDFSGKIYGGWGSPMEEAMLKALAKQYRIEFKKIRMVNIGSADFFASVQREVDFSWIFYGWDGVAAKIKNFPINFIMLRKVNPRFDYYTPVLITSEKIIIDNPGLIRRFLEATTKGYTYTIQNPKKAAEILLKNAPEIDSKLAVASQEYLAKEYQADAKCWGEMKEVIWTNYSEWMFENGLLPKKLNVKEAFTNEFLPAR